MQKLQDQLSIVYIVHFLDDHIVLSNNISSCNKVRSLASTIMRSNSSCEESVQISSIDKDFFLVFQLRKGPLPSVVVLYSYFVNYLSNDSATLLLILSLITVPHRVHLTGLRNKYKTASQIYGV